MSDNKECKRDMNILHVADIPQSQLNGTSVVVPEHVRNQALYENVHFLNFNSNSEVDFNLPNGILINEMEWNKIGYRGLIERIGKPDLVVFHGVYKPKLWDFYYRYVKEKTPFIVLPHGSMTRVAQKKSRIKKYLANHLVVYPFTRKALAVQFLSETEFSNSDKAFFTNSFIMGNGVYPQDKKAIFPKDSKVHFVSIGRISVWYKGLDLLIDACKLLQESGEVELNNICLDIYGDDEENGVEYLQGKLNEYCLNNWVKMHGSVIGEEKEKILTEEASYFIMTSRSEGQPMGALEALSYGLPIIVTPGTSFAKEVQSYNCGLTMDANPQSIKDAIVRAVRQYSQRTEMSENALKCVEKNYWSSVVLETLETYRTLVKAGGLN